MMASSRLAHPITVSVHPTLEQDLVAWRHGRHFLTLDQTDLWIRGGSEKRSCRRSVWEATQMLSETVVGKAAETTVMCHFCVCVWKSWFVKLIHS